MKSRAQVRGGAEPSEAELQLNGALQEVASDLGGKYSLANGKSASFSSGSSLI
jgi:hypothetical protein